MSFALPAVSHMYVGVGPPAYDRLRRVAASAAVELAFRRHLSRRNVPFGVTAPVVLGDPDRYVVTLRGHRCKIHTFLIRDRQQALAVQEDPRLLLSAPALVPVEEYAAEGSSPEDLYLFAFVLDATASGEAMQHGQVQSCIVHLMPGNWARPASWVPLRPLGLKSEGKATLRLELVGQDQKRQNLASCIELAAQVHQEIQEDFYALGCLRVSELPTARLGIHSPARPGTIILQPADWHNISIQAGRMYLAGWTTQEQFRQRAELIRQGSRVFQFSRTRTNNLAVKISELRPIERLL